ncbi:MAG TPA: hypothetical protein VE090_03455 [Methylomirabilota bacterium]|nr:hypothetical protein [Methylomirabilota bacterium]
MAGKEFIQQSHTFRRREDPGSQVNVPRVALTLSEQVQKTPALITKIDTILEENERSKPFFSQKVIVDFAPKKREAEDPAYFFSKEWLQDEVERVKQQPLTPGETPWYHLAGTGFWVKEQVSQLLRNTSEVGKEAFPAVLDRELAKVKVDIEAFEDEYLKQMASLKWNLSWEEKDGNQRVVCPDYGNVLWQSATDLKERDGVVYKTLFGDEQKGTTGVEGWLKTAPPESFAILVSPAGWSGLSDADGKAIVYPETQMYAIQKKKDGNLQAYTFRYDATIEQNETLQKQLGLTIPASSDQKERIKNTFANVAFITPADANRAEQKGWMPVRKFEDIVDHMQEAVGGREVAYGEGGAMKTFADIKAFLHSPEKFSKRHAVTDKLINRFQEYARWRLDQGGRREELERDLQIGLSMAPLQLNRIYRDEEQESQYNYTGDKLQGQIRPVSATNRLIGYATSGMDYRREKGDLEQRPGCAGGGNKTQVTSMGSSRIGESQSPQEWFTCPKCNYHADGPVGNSCPGCGLTKEQYAEESGVSCD